MKPERSYTWSTDITDWPRAAQPTFNLSLSRSPPQTSFPIKSLDANSGDKLPITRQDKHEAAFTLVKHKFRRDLDMPWAELANRAGVSERLVFKMPAMLKEALTNHNEAIEWSWMETFEQGSG